MYGDQIAQELPLGHSLRSASLWPVSPDQLKLLAEDVVRTLSLPLNTKLLPGTDIGFLNLKCKKNPIADFEWPGGNKIIINFRTYQVLLDKGLTGWQVAPVLVNGAVEVDKEPICYQLLSVGKAGIAQTIPAVQESFHCLECGYTKYEIPFLQNFSLDIKKWDGSDFMRFDPPFNAFNFITHKAKLTLEAEGLLNYEIFTLQEFVDRYNKNRKPKA